MIPSYREADTVTPECKAVKPWYERGLYWIAFCAVVCALTIVADVLALAIGFAAGCR